MNVPTPMSRIAPTERKLLEKLVDDEFSIREIAAILGRSYNTVQRQVYKYRNGLSSDREYEQALAQKRGKTTSKLRQEQRLKRGFKTEVDMLRYYAAIHGMTLTQARQAQAARHGMTVYQQVSEYVKNKGFKSPHAYKKHLATEVWGFKSLNKYLLEKERNRKRKRKNIAFRQFMSEQLKLVAKSKVWLAEQIGISKTGVRLYFSGSVIPREPVRQRIYEAFGVPYHTLDDIVAKYGGR